MHTPVLVICTPNPITLSLLLDVCLCYPFQVFAATCLAAVEWVPQNCTFCTVISSRQTIWVDCVCAHE